MLHKFGNSCPCYPCFAVFRDQDEFDGWHDRGDTVLHIELRNIADAFVICPLSSKMLYNMSQGQCNDLLSNVFRGWPYVKDEYDNWVI